MASDARTMLRAARAARKIHHSDASHTAGNLSCTVCGTVFKTEVQWESHIRSLRHIELLRKAKPTDAGLPSRKRKAEDSGSEQDEVKRSRVTSAEPELKPKTTMTARLPSHPSLQQGMSEASLAVHDREWDAFERDLADLEGTQAQHALPQSARASVITAAPVSAEELAVQAREAQSQQRGASEEEFEAEDEEAAVRTNEEAEEMERLQERMQKLREKRAALRKTNPVANAVLEQERSNGLTSEETAIALDDEDDQDEDDWVIFGFRRR